MFDLLIDHKDAQRQFAARIQEAQESHADQRRMMQQLGRLLHWVGERLIIWSQNLQAPQHSLELQSSKSTAR